MYKALNNLQWLMYHKTKPNQNEAVRKKINDRKNINMNAQWMQFLNF